MQILEALSAQGSLFYLQRHGYVLDRPLNNQNRWDTKIVYSLLDRDSKKFVSTTYAKSHDYLKFIETSTFLKCKDKLSPEILKVYPEHKTVICEHVGEFLQDYLLAHPEAAISSLIVVFDYLKDISSINQAMRCFIIPPIVKLSLELSEEIEPDFDFLPKFKKVIPELKKSNLRFMYGYGIEDPHIWNFRILNGSRTRPLAFTTDFDYFSDTVNYFWELGYLYATFRWFKKISPVLSLEAESALLSLTGDVDTGAEFMFWLGALSSYCGYKDSLCSFLKGDSTYDLHKEHSIIKELDDKISNLANRLIGEQNHVNPICADFNTCPDISRTGS